MKNGVRGGFLLLSFTVALLMVFSPASAAEPKNLTPLQPAIIMNAGSLSPAGDYSLLVGTNGTLVISNGTTTQSVSTGIAFSLSGIAWRPDGSYALITGEGGTLLKFSNVKMGVLSIDSGTAEDLTGVSWKPDGSFALITGENGLIIRFNHDSQKCLRINTNSNSKFKDVFWDESGEHAEITGDNGSSVTYPPIRVGRPAVLVDEPAEGAVMAGTFTVRGSASVDNSTIVRVEVRIDSGGWVAAAGTGSWEVSLDTRPYSNGDHTLSVRAWSTEGASAAASVGFRVENLVLPPLLEILSPSDCARLFGTISIDGTASSFSGVIDRVDIRVDDSDWGRALGTGLWRISFDTTTVPNGVHRIQVRVFDGAQFSQVSRVIIVENLLPEPAAPAAQPRPAPAPGPVMAPVEDRGSVLPPVNPAPGPAPPDVIPAPAVEAGPAADGGTIVVPAFSWAILLVSALALGSEHGKYAIFQFLFVPLYSRIKKDAVLDNFTRGMIYGFIMSNPGVHYNFIKQKLGLNNGSIVYHLTVLERQELIKSEKVGLYKRFYPIGQTLSETGIMELNETQVRLLEILRAAPGLTQRDLAEKMDISSRVVNYHVGLLQRARLVTLERVGKVTKCYATERMPVC